MNIRKAKKGTKKSLNFLQRGKKHRRGLRWQLISILVAFVVFLCALGSAGYVRAKNIERTARTGEAAFREAQAQALELDFSAAKQSTDAAIDAFATAHNNIGVLRLFKFIPFLGKQIAAGDNILLLAKETGAAIREVLDIADAALTTIAQNNDLTPDALTAEERRQILGALDQGEESLTKAGYHLDNARTAYHDIPTSGLIGPLKDISAALSEQFPLIEETIDNALPFTRILPYIAGYPDGITYLFLLQNNQELRPTGGFIGTYGILTVDSGEITEFTTDNVYTLDEAAESRITRKAPAPLQQYLAANQWFFRDVNWSPDFPTTAKDALALYDEEARSTAAINGVIAVTPVLLKDLLGITGPIVVDGVTFTEENAIEELRFQVDRGSASRGEFGNERKGIIGRLGQELVGKLQSLPQKEWSKLWTVFLDNIQRRQVLMYVEDQDIQAVLHDRAWDGALLPTPDDYLHITDANLASLKTDSVIQRSIAHQVDLETGEATVTMTYTHTGEFSSTITRYRTYVRTYVPYGSELIDSDGFMTNDRLQGGKPTAATTSAELGYTVFSGFVSIEPGEAVTTTVHYRLPAELVRRLAKEGYNLTVQKQAGLEQATLTSTIKLGKTISHADPVTAQQTLERTQVTFSTEFEADQFFHVE